MVKSLGSEGVARCTEPAAAEGACRSVAGCVLILVGSSSELAQPVLVRIR